VRFFARLKHFACVPARARAVARVSGQGLIRKFISGCKVIMQKNHIQNFRQIKDNMLKTNQIWA